MFVVVKRGEWDVTNNMCAVDAGAAWIGAMIVRRR